MGKIADSLITKTGAKTDSYYEYVISRYIAPRFTLFFKRVGIENPNIVTLYSFFLILIASAMLFFFALLDSILYRILIAVLIQVSFALDCSDGQLARITGRASKLGAWLDRILDRLGEFTVFICFGYVAWQQYDIIFLLYLGIVIGYGQSIFTMAMTISDSIQFDNIKIIASLMKKPKRKASYERYRSRKEKREKIFSVLSKIFFFLNFDIGERYLYPSFFIVVNRIDIMLYIASLLSVIRFLSISNYTGKKLKRFDRSIEERNEKGIS